MVILPERYSISGLMNTGSVKLPMPSGRVGQGADPTHPDGNGNFTEPVLIHPDNGFAYEGTPLKVALGTFAGSGGRSQFALLTTEGLYVWGEPESLVDGNVKSNAVFGKVKIG